MLKTESSNNIYPFEEILDRVHLLVSVLLFYFFTRGTTTYHICFHHHHKHQGLDPLIRSVSRVNAARANASSVFQLFSFLVVCSGMISKGLIFVAFFASVKASSISILGRSLLA